MADQEMQVNTDYFDSYEDLEIHELMLKDKPRQDAYHNAILSNKELFRDKVVLDVGSGTGILSIFCAQAGAKRVFAVEASNLAKLSQEIVQENNFEEIIKVYNCRIEEFQLPDEFKKVDIIVSEWMGFYLLHEGMLDSVIYARDTFLHEEGHMFPESATILVAPCSVPSHYEDWLNVNGVKMTSFADQLRLQKSQKPEVLVLNPDNLLCDGEVMSWFDLKEVSHSDLDDLFFKEIIVPSKGGKFQGVCIWFECTFPSAEASSPVTLSTSPACDPTHWKQTVIILPKSTEIELEQGEPIAFHLNMKRNEFNQRRYNLQLELLDADKMQHPLPCNCLMTKCILTKAHLEKMETSGL